MDDDAVDDLTSLDIDADTRRKLAPKYAKLDATERQQLTEFIEQGSDCRTIVAAEIDGKTLDELLDIDCRSGTPSISPEIISSGRQLSIRLADSAGLGESSDCPGTKLLKTVADDTEMSGDEFNDKMSRLGKSQLKPFANSVLEASDPAAYLDDLSPRIVGRIAKEGSDGSFRLTSQAYDLANGGDYQVGKPDDFAELYAHAKLERKLGNDYRVSTQVDVSWKDSLEDKELDHLITRDDRVVGFAETKNSISSGKADEAAGQLGDIRRRLRNSGADKINTKQGSYDVPDDISISSETIQEDRQFTIGGSSEFDVETVNPDLMDDLYTTLVNE